MALSGAETIIPLGWEFWDLRFEARHGERWVGSSVWPRAVGNS